MSILIPCILLFLSSLILTVFIEKRLIPLLSQKAKQPIYEGGPTWHLSKQGTPTMGGLAFLISISLSLLLCAIYFLNFGKGREIAVSILISFLFALGNSFIGIADDLTKIRRNQNGGLTAAQKLLLQSLLAILFLMARRHYFLDDSILQFSFGGIDVGFLYYPLAFLILLGIINCANLTDGIDGLAASVGLTIGAFLMLSMSLVPAALSLLASTLAGGCLGFLLFNVHPAKIFMGDTGSLFIGALVATIGFSLSNPLIIILFGAVYVFEGISVILQVIVFKLTGQRIFKMAPIHHHLEKNGYDESRICVTWVIVTLISSLIALLLI